MENVSGDINVMDGDRLVMKSKTFFYEFTMIIFIQFI